MLAHGRVHLNGRVCRIAAQIVQAGDRIELASAASGFRIPGGIDILHEDEHLLVIHKPAGLLTVATLHERERTAYAYIRNYLRRRSRRRQLFVVHRLDKFVSGILVFAKSEEIKEKLQSLFRRHTIDRRYWAIVEGPVKEDNGVIRSRLAEDRGKRMRSTEKPGEGKEAVTHYRVLRRFRHLTSLEIRLETGRKNQIRAHLSELGHPIAGDRAYGSSTNPLRRMGLHAFRLGFRHPVDGRPLRFETAPPPQFQKYLPGAGSR